MWFQQEATANLNASPFLWQTKADGLAAQETARPFNFLDLTCCNPWSVTP
jgi:hypothetical protein